LGISKGTTWFNDLVKYLTEFREYSGIIVTIIVKGCILKSTKEKDAW
jgi:hypothetical protein